MSSRRRSTRLRVARVLAVFWWAQFLPAPASAGCLREYCEAGSCYCVGFCRIWSEVVVCEFDFSDCFWDYCMRMRCYAMDGGYPECPYTCCTDDYQCCSYECAFQCPA